MFELLPKNVAGKRFIDLGSGDGVTVIAAAERGMHGHGVEVSACGVVWRCVHV